MGKWLLIVYIVFICTNHYSNGQWGVTTHDIPPQREDRKLDILENIKILSAKQKHAMERRCQYFYSHKVFTLSSKINQSWVQS